MPRMIRKEWQETLDARETAFAKRHISPPNQSTHGRELQPLSIGQEVQIQNQSGNKYTVRVDGSRRITLRNRKFLKPINSVCSNQKRWIDLVPSIESENNPPQQQPEQCSTIEEPNRTSSDPITPHLQLKTFQTTSPSPPASPLSTLQKTMQLATSSSKSPPRTIVKNF